jgi:hypothetical protein
MIPDFSWYLKDSLEPLLELKLEKSPGTVLLLNPKENSLVRHVSDIKQPDKEKKIKKLLLEIFKIILIISIIPSLFFLLKKKIKKSIIALVVIVFLSVIIGFFVITKIFVKQSVYGIVSEGSSPVNVYVIPEEFGAIKFIVENEETVRIIGEKEQFFLIETYDKGNRGWVKKENIILGNR